MKSFVNIKTRIQTTGRGDDKTSVCVVSPSYEMPSKDIMMRGGKFYAIYDEQTGMWSRDENDVQQIIDQKLFEFRDKHFKQDGYGNYRTEKGYLVTVSSVGENDSGELKKLNVWFKNLPPNYSYKPLDNSITFYEQEVSMEDYRSKRLPYKIEKGSIDNYSTLMKKLYTAEELDKIEWSIGSVFTGDSKEDDKILVLYGDPGTGKSTVLDLLKDLFCPYWVPFTAAGLARSSDQFATSVFSENPLVAIQDDGNLSKIDSPTINEIISHKEIIVNEKGVRRYSIKPLAKLFLATNETVDIHDTKLGIARRLLDVYPTGEKFPIGIYRKLVKGLKFETGAIAYHCIERYKELGKDYYSNYEPNKMIDKTNYLRNFLFDTLDDIQAEEYHTRNELYSRYKQYCEESGLGYPPKRIVFGEQLKGYFREYYPLKKINGRTERHVYGGFKGLGKSTLKEDTAETDNNVSDWLSFKPQSSLFDDVFKDCPAQYDTLDDSHPLQYSWKNCKTRLSDIDTKKLHYVNIPDNYNLIFIDFDIKNDKGEKDAKANIEAASDWPKTYGEFSKSGAGIHLYYFYSGDIDKLQSHYTPDIEIKITKGGRAIRRMLTKCNSEPIATISSGLPLKGEKKKMIGDEVIKTNRGLHTFIQRCLRKEHHGATAPEVSFMYKKLEESYEAGVRYDVTDMYDDIRNFAMGSHNQKDKCMDLFHKMHLKSDEPAEQIQPEGNGHRMAFFDVEVFPNLFVFCYKFRGTKKDKASVLKLINPSPSDIYNLFKEGPNSIEWIGFNNRRYDNHICWARIMGYSNGHLYDLSRKIINGEHNAFFQDAYNISYTDIYDYASTKQSLKKWEIKLGIHHQENHYPWDQDIDKSHWDEVADYCANDVLATEEVFDATQEDFMAREILSTAANKLCPSIKSTVNDTTNQLTTRVIFRGVKNPQEQFVYTDLSEEFPGYSYERGEDGKMHNMYRGEDVGFGGYVYATPGMYGDVALLDIASMHPHSIKALNLFGPFTKNFTELMDTRIAVKHKEWDKARKMLDGALADYIPDKFNSTEEERGLSKKLAKALKIAINSVYGLTSATFANPFKDPRNVNNIVALRGALFMVNLKHEVMDRGYTVAHIKTDSIKIPWADDEIIKFVTDYGRKYGYEFEHEATFDRMCLLNGSTYICKVKEGEENGAGPGEWSGTGTEVQKDANPYVFKRLFSHEDIEFSDLCETKSVKSAMYLDFNEGLDDVSEFEKLKNLRSSSKASLTKAEQSLLEKYRDLSDEDLDKEIIKGHRYKFVGKVGLFTPLVHGAGGGLLVREQNDKYYSVTGAKGYRWMESADVQALHLEPKIDYSFYDNLVEETKKDIQQFGSFDLFVSNEPIPKPEPEDKILDPMKEDIDPADPLADIYCDDLPF